MVVQAEDDVGVANNALVRYFVVVAGTRWHKASVYESRVWR